VKLNKKISEIYKDSDYGVQRMAPAFWILSIVSVVLMSLILILKIINKESFIESLNTYIIITAIIFSQYFLYKGKYDVATLFFSSGVFLGLTTTMFLESRVTIQIPYRHAVNYMLLIISTGMISHKLFNLKIIFSATILSYVLITYMAISKGLVESHVKSLNLQLILPTFVMLAGSIAIYFMKSIELGIIRDIYNKLKIADKEKGKRQEVLNSIKVQLNKSSDLITLSGTANSASESIDERVQQVKVQMDILQTKFRNSSTALNTISNEIINLKSVADNQSVNVTQTSASIEEMNASILNVANVIFKKKDTVSSLLDSSASGERSINETINSFNEVIENFENIKEMTTVIDDIASQTNLLSMNAAIEAAHAGDAGKGFAVVADEIRKLAESSSSNAKNIGNRIIDLVKSIENTGNEVKRSGDSFQSIHQEIIEVSRAMEEISSSASELSEGSNEILTATSLLNSLTTKVSSGVEEVLNNHNIVNSDLSGITEASGNILSSLSSITNDTSTIKDDIKEISQMAREIDSHMNSI